MRRFKVNLYQGIFPERRIFIMSGNKGNGGFALFCCFIALGVSAVIAFITYLLPLVSDSIVIGGDVMNILGIIFEVSSLVGLGFGAFAFAARRGFIVKLLTTIFVLVFLVAVVLAIIGII